MGRFITLSYIFCSLQYYFEGRYDLVRFIKLVQEAGLYVHLRIGPYICAEWNFGSVAICLQVRMCTLSYMSLDLMVSALTSF